MSGREWTQNDQGVGGWKEPSGGSQPVLAIVRLSAHIDDWFGDTIPFDTVVLDPDGLWDAVNHQFVAATAGWYSVSTFGVNTPAEITVPVGGTGTASLDALVFGPGDNLHSDVFRSADVTQGGYFYPQISGITSLGVGDAIEIEGNGGIGFTVPAGFSFAIQLVLAA